MKMLIRLISLYLTMIRKLVILVVPLFLSMFVSIYADRGVIPIPPVPIREDWQLAIIAWNDGEEVLILSTVLTPILKPVSGKTLPTTFHGIEILPLKSIPYVEKAEYKYFYILERLTYRYGIISPEYAPSLFGKTRDGVEIIYQKRIGPHEITVLKVNSSEDLVKWLIEYAGKNRLPVPDNNSLKKYIEIFKDYIDRGYEYFAIDAVIFSFKKYDGKPIYEPYSIHPLLYKFSSRYIYYPLKVSGLMEEDTRIKLYILSKDRLKPEDINSLGFQITFEKRIDIEEIKGLHEEVIKLFKNTDKIWLTVIIYKGEASKLTKDLEIYTGFSIWQYMSYILFMIPIFLSIIISIVVYRVGR